MNALEQQGQSYTEPQPEVIGRPRHGGAQPMPDDQPQTTINFYVSPSSTIDELRIIGQMPESIQAEAMKMAKKEQAYRHDFIATEAQREHEMKDKELTQSHERELYRLKATAWSEIVGKVMGFIALMLLIAAVVFMAYKGLYLQLGAALVAFFTLLFGLAKAFICLMARNRTAK